MIHKFNITFNNDGVLVHLRHICPNLVKKHKCKIHVTGHNIKTNTERQLQWGENISKKNNHRRLALMLTKILSILAQGVKHWHTPSYRVVGTNINH